MNESQALLNLTEDEKKIYDWLKLGKRTQLQLAGNLKWLGSDPVHEGYAGRETTLRKVRRLIHQIREKGIAIVSGDGGYALCESRDDKISYLDMCIKKEAVRARNAHDYHAKLFLEWNISEDEVKQLKMEI